MTISSSRLRLVARILLAAVLLQFLAPTVGATVIGGAQWIEICTASGSKWIQAGADDQKSKSDNHAASSHCVFCSSSGATPAFDATQYVLQVATWVVALPVVDFRVPELYAGHAILSRAPPALS